MTDEQESEAGSACKRLTAVRDNLREFTPSAASADQVDISYSEIKTGTSAFCSCFVVRLQRDRVCLTWSGVELNVTQLLKVDKRSWWEGAQILWENLVKM